jgi:hypothetical protein
VKRFRFIQRLRELLLRLNGGRKLDVEIFRVHAAIKRDQAIIDNLCDCYWQYKNTLISKQERRRKWLTVLEKRKADRGPYKHVVFRPKEK